MALRISILGVIQVAPVQTVNPETGEEEDGKELQILMPETGDIYRYAMGKELANTVGKSLRMTNAALKARIEEEMAREQARQTIMGGNGAILGPDGQAIARDIIGGAENSEN